MSETKLTKIESSDAAAASGFHHLGLKPALVRVMDTLGFTQPTPIQEKTIPVALTSQDLIGIAQTGTGKTFAFGLPLIERIAVTKGQGLIVEPTRELALQVDESLKKIGRPLGLRTAVLIGGDVFDRQLFQLRKKPHLIIATPGRLLDHLKRRTVKLDRVNTVVLDEADMMLDLGFAPQIAEIFQQLPTERQTMLFSATMPPAIAKIAAQHLKAPVKIAVAPQGTAAERVDQEIFMINHEDRFTCLQRILARYTGSVLIFVRTKHGVKSLALKLREAGEQATEIHSDLSFRARKNSLDSFKTKKKRILVATDVAARGLDIDGIELVVNYNLPDCPEDYVHRIGRTGRAGKTGKAISLATANENTKIKTIERLISQDIKRTGQTQASKPAKPSQPKKSFRSDKPFRSKKPFKSVTPEAHSFSKSHRPDKPHQTDRYSQPKKPFRSDKPFRSKKPFKSAESEHYSPFKSEKPNKPTRFAKSAGARPQRSFAADTTEQPSSRKFVTHSHPQSSAYAKPYNHKPYSHKKSAPASGSIYHRSKTLATKFSRSKHRSDK